MFEGFLKSLEKAKPKKKEKCISITPINLENFQLEKLGNGILKPHDIAALYKWSKSTLQIIAQQISFLAEFCPGSPQYWLKDIKKKNEEGDYSISIDLERFISSKRAKEFAENKAPFFIPDNYELAPKVLEAFKTVNINKKYEIHDNSHREFAQWESKDFQQIKELADFITKTYVEPELNRVLKEEKIKKVKFKNNKIDFEYES